jgi:hypothetical protein
LSFDEDILAFFVLAIVLAIFFKLWANFFPKLLVTLILLDMMISLKTERQKHSSFLFVVTSAEKKTRM